MGRFGDRWQTANRLGKTGDPAIVHRVGRDRKHRRGFGGRGSARRCSPPVAAVDRAGFAIAPDRIGGDRWGNVDGRPRRDPLHRIDHGADHPADSNSGLPGAAVGVGTDGVDRRGGRRGDGCGVFAGRSRWTAVVAVVYDQPHFYRRDPVRGRHGLLSVLDLTASGTISPRSLAIRHRRRVVRRLDGVDRQCDDDRGRIGNVGRGRVWQIFIDRPGHRHLFADRVGGVFDVHTSVVGGHRTDRVLAVGAMAKSVPR